MFNQISPAFEYAIYKEREQELERKIEQRLDRETRQEKQAEKEAYTAYVAAANALKEKADFRAAQKPARAEKPCSGVPC